MLIQLARMQILFSMPCPLHTAMSAYSYCYALVLSKRPVRVKLHSHRGVETNPVNRSRIGSKFGWYGKVNQKLSRFANVPFHSHLKKKGRSTFRTCRVSTVHASAFHLLSPSILEKLSFPTEVPVFFFYC